MPYRHSVYSALPSAQAFCGNLVISPISHRRFMHFAHRHARARTCTTLPMHFPRARIQRAEIVRQNRERDRFDTRPAVLQDYPDWSLIIGLEDHLQSSIFCIDREKVSKLKQFVALAAGVNNSNWKVQLNFFCIFLWHTVHNSNNWEQDWIIL